MTDEGLLEDIKFQNKNMRPEKSDFDIDAEKRKNKPSSSGKGFQITKKGLAYFTKLSDEGDSNISDDWEYSLGEAFDWVDQNSEVTSIEEMCRIRGEWLRSNENQLFSGGSEKQIKKDMQGFEKALQYLSQKGFIKKGE
jgi:hypothetical protein